MKIKIDQTIEQPISVHSSYVAPVIAYDEDPLIKALTDGTLSYQKAGKTILSIKRDSNGIELYVDDNYIK